MNVAVCIPVESWSSTTGMLGTPNGDMFDEWPRRDGSFYEFYPVNYHGQGGYDYCTSEWCVADDFESLFGPEDFDSFNHCFDGYRGDIDISDVPPEVAAFCNGLPTPMNQLECMEDMAVTPPLERERCMEAIIEHNRTHPPPDIFIEPPNIVIDQFSASGDEPPVI